MTHHAAPPAPEAAHTTVIGLMSGTSCDAVDAAAARITRDGSELRLTPLGMVSEPYDDELRQALAAALPPGRTTLGDVCRLDTRIGQAFARLAARADRELCAGRAELIASHGQTVFHWADGGLVHGTLQLGEPAWIAEATGLPVVSGFRTRDIAAGGQGAPLVGLIDRMLLRGHPGVPAALNVGGIANATVLTPDGTPAAFDSGPGNALLDAAARHLTAGRLDRDTDGRLAARGAVHRPLLDRLLAEPYYVLPAPKTTGRELFHSGYLRTALDAVGPLSTPDVLATLTRLTARTVADALRPFGVTEVLASGGGTCNPVLMAALRQELGAAVRLRTSDAMGLPSAAKEAYAFAVLGYLTLHGLPGTVPQCTGAAGPRVLGSLTPGRTPLRLPPPLTEAPRTLTVTPPPAASTPPAPWP
ncbi:anhydro-N-acetylmuramic acid kinase [Streptomyces sp. NBC_00555]|uniref:anhydro-N-acetylmuramic acid kinase n=1 Tax=Streptomyces sp. NBC_00555 TaxID=2903662 RepID=UPI00225896C2|nr:anhydro-N-acetylmuramic acid kinase [Streptomyces sp. NBC_00555]MCX5015472.1 anhydro-N-acetylmuramic acid kinase [Streptomyces sp. NBC_00555]